MLKDKKVIKEIPVATEERPKVLSGDA